MTHPDDLADWRQRADRLADEITACGALHDPRWRAALRATPRHVLVPRYFTQDDRAAWTEVSSTDPATRDTWAEGVYANTPLVTAIDRTDATSSSSQPSLMIRMLEALDLGDGHRVLEIGTGTGYNVALLSHRLADRRVYSVDIDAECVDHARRRLAGLDLHPHLARLDGEDAWPDHAPYDRIVATCSVSAVPWMWAEQTAVGGLVLADVKVGAGAGNLALLHRLPDRLEGRFLPKWAGFMALRRAVPTPAERPLQRAPEAGTSLTPAVDPRPWDNPIVGFLAQLNRPDSNLTSGLTLDPSTRRPISTFLATADGSWCEIEHLAEDGQHRIRWGGPTTIWAGTEDAYRHWEDTGRPGWDRFGITVTAAGNHIWLDDPEPEHGWKLPS